MREFVSFECAWKAEEQQSGYYNLVSWKIKDMGIRNLILNEADLPGVTKDELKKIVICHFAAENAAFCVTKLKWAMSTPFPSKKSRRKKKLKKPKKVTADVSDSIFQ